MTALYFKGLSDAFQRFLQDGLAARGYALASRPEETDVLVLSPLEEPDIDTLTESVLKKDKTIKFIESLSKAQLGLSKLIFLSSEAVYGEGDYICGDCGPIINHRRDKNILGNFRWEMFCPICGDMMMPQSIVESSLAQPQSIRGQLLSHYEAALRRLAPELGWPVVVLRFFGPYWPQPAFLETGGVVACFTRALLAQESLEIFEDGNQMRDFTYGEDVLQAMTLAIRHQTEDYQVYNVGSGERILIQDLAAYLQEFLNRTDVELNVNEQYREGDIRHRFANIDRTCLELGYQPQYCILSGLEAFGQKALSFRKAPAGQRSG